MFSQATLDMTTLPSRAPHATSPEELEAENARLKAENEQLRRDRETLKKTLQILVEEDAAAASRIARSA